MDSNEAEATCTICGLKYEDRVSFNAHIRAHLKDKLTNRREQQKLKLEQQKTASPGPSINEATQPLCKQSLETPTSKAFISSSPSPASDSTTAVPVPNAGSVKRAKVTLANEAKDQDVIKNATVSRPSAAAVADIQSLLPSSPLPISKATSVKDKPDLEALLNQLQNSQKLASNHPMVMAELAACKPIPPQEVVGKLKPVVTSTPPTSTMALWGTTSVPASQTVTNTHTEDSIAKYSPESTALAMTPCTPEISDMEDDNMFHEMEMNRIDFHNDLASILDQIEKDFESPCLSHDLRLDTPPDSDCENADQLNRLLEGQNLLTTDAPPALFVQPSLPSTSNNDLLGLDRFSQRIPMMDDSSASASASTLLKLENEQQVRLVQSPASVAKVGKLPAKTLAVLNKLPAKLFVPNSPGNGNLRQSPNQMTESSNVNFVDVVKVEQTMPRSNQVIVKRSFFLHFSAYFTYNTKKCDYVLMKLCFSIKIGSHWRSIINSWNSMHH